MSQRTRRALEARKQAGQRLGRPRALDPTLTLVARIVADHEPGPTQLGIAGTLNAVGPPTTGRLPVYGDRFVGRSRQLAELARLVESVRMVTLTGPAGVGKTRLALELARAMSDGGDDRAWFVELTPLAEAAGVPRAVASRLAVWDHPGRSLSEMVVAHLRHRRVLLVLDNCDHLVGPCAELATAILEGCPEVTIVATSRSPLGIARERLWKVPALSLPSAGDKLERMATSEAVRLFADRASSAHRGFVLDGEVAALVTEICRRLNGIPLAIELAAARVGALAPAEIAAHLHERLSALPGGTKEPLRPTLDWSHGLLAAREQALLRRMSIFIGGCTLEAVESVCSDGAHPGGVLDPLSSLVARSLVVADTTGARARYRLLETVRGYGVEQLELAGEIGERRELHAQWCVALAERAQPLLIGAEQQTWLDALETDHDNIRSALAWAIAAGRSDVALRLAGSLTLFWRMRGHFREGRRWLEAALAMDGDQPPTVRARALWGAGFFAHMLNDDAEATPRLEESLALARATEDIAGQARALLLLANTKVYAEPAAGLVLLEQSVPLARAAGDSWCLAHVLALAGLARVQMGDGGARGVLEESLAVARHAADQHSMCIGLNLLGDLALGRGDYRSAEELLVEAVSLARRIGERYALSRALSWLGEVALGRGRYDEAASHLSEALSLDRQVAPAAVPAALCTLGQALRAQGHIAGARKLFAEALELDPSVDGPRPVTALQGLGECAAADGDVEAARSLFEEALTAARGAGHRGSVAAALHELANVARSQGDLGKALSQHHEALEGFAEVRGAPGVAQSLEAVAGVTGQFGRHQQAARLLGAAESLRQATGYASAHRRWPEHHRDVDHVRDNLGPDRFTKLFAEGASLSMDQAIAYAQRGRGARGRPSTGWASLTRAEEDVVKLATEGLTNAQIGERLFISPRTAARHLYHVFAKLEISSRTELAREASRRDESGR